MGDNKEALLKDSLEAMSIQSMEKILYQMRNCVCKILHGEINGTGFFIKMPFHKNKLLNVLITNNHILNEEDIKDGKNISVSLNNEKSFKYIYIDSERKRYTSIDLDITIIEIKEDKDNIKDFLELDKHILDLYEKKINEFNCLNEIYKKESIYIFYN